MKKQVNQEVKHSFQDEAIALGFDLHNGLSSCRAIQHVQAIIENEIPGELASKFSGKDTLSRCNQIIIALGCTPVIDHNQARIIAKGLAEQLVLQGLTYEPNVALAIVAGKLVKMEKQMPWCFTGGADNVTPTLGIDLGGTILKQKKSGPKRGGDKKERAFAVYNEMKAANPDVADMAIAKETSKRHTDMTVANAYYYVTRVFQKKVK